MEKPTKTGELRLGLLKVGHGAPGKRKSDSGHVVVRFADGLDCFGNAGQIVNRDAARFAAGRVRVGQDAVIFFTIAWDTSVLCIIARPGRDSSF